MKTLGIRHIALNVQDPKRTKKFYMQVMKMQLEWEPDPDNVYLTSGGMDNLAIHRATSATGSGQQHLDHFGFAVPAAADVDEWHAWIQSQGVQILKEIKTHRDGARSFYFADPDGNVIQIIHHPPISKTSYSK